MQARLVRRKNVASPFAAGVFFGLGLGGFRRDSAASIAAVASHVKQLVPSSAGRGTWGSYLGVQQCLLGKGSWYGKAFLDVMPRYTFRLSLTSLMARFHGFDGGFCFRTGLINRVAGKRYVWCIGLRHLFHDRAFLRQRIENYKKGRLALSSLRTARDYRRNEEEQADENLFHRNSISQRAPPRPKRS